MSVERNFLDYSQRVARRYVIVFAVASLLLAANPWKLSDWSEYYSSTTIHRLLPLSIAWRNPVKLVVVVADDSYLDATSALGLDDPGKTWPLPYAAYTRVLTRARAAGAQAVFFDFTIADLRSDPTYANFLEALRENAKDMHILIVAGTSESGFRRVVRPEIDALAKASPDRIHLVSALAGTRDPPALPSYRLAPSAEGYPAAAIKLLEIVCGERERCERPSAQRMEVVWAAPVPAWNCQTPSEDTYDGCRSQAKGPAGRLYQLLVLGAVDNLCRLFSPDMKGCYPQAAPEISNAYHKEYSLQDFFAGAYRDEVNSDLRGGVLLVGHNFAYAQDQVRSPVYGVAPGVRMQAMALENLLQLGPRALPAPETDDALKARRNILHLGIALLSALALRLAAWPAWLWVRGKGLGPQVGGADIALVGLGLVVLQMVLSAALQPPANWLGALSAWLLASAVVRWRWSKLWTEGALGGLVKLVSRFRDGS